MANAVMTNAKIIYARVWHYRWFSKFFAETQDGHNVQQRIGDKPVGVISAINQNVWVKVNKKWLRTSKYLSARDKFAVLEYISKAEYETDLAFGLWPKLRITYRPIRTWFNKNSDRIAQVSSIVALLIAVAGRWSVWLAVFLLALYALGCIWLIIKSN